MARKRITIVIETLASDDALRKAFLKCGLVDIRFIEIEEVK